MDRQAASRENILTGPNRAPGGTGAPNVIDRDHFAGRREGLVVQDGVLSLGLAPIPGAVVFEQGHRVDAAAGKEVEGGGG